MVRRCRGVLQNISLPKAKDPPSRCAQELVVRAIPLLISPNLGDPIVRIVAPREPSEPTGKVPTMPEVPVAKDGQSLP